MKHGTIIKVSSLAEVPKGAHLVTTESITTGSNNRVEELKQWLATRLSSERFEHSLGAQEKALELVAKYKLPLALHEKVSLAGLLHDCAKLMPSDELVDYCKTNNLPVDEWDLRTPQTLHPFVGADIVQKELKIMDVETLDAIRYHTTARTDMGMVEKIVFIADKIEGNTRNPLYTQKITANIDFKRVESVDKTVLYILNSTVQFLMDKNQLIHPRTIDARNGILVEMKNNK